MKRKSPPRHFPYSHPSFGTYKRPKSASAWEGSVYYWWWAYLRRNQDYLDCCATGGAGALAWLYQDFGDVRDDNFKAWWIEGQRGVRLFAEPPADDLVRVLDLGDRVESTDGILTVSLPLTLPTEFVLRRCREILNNSRKGGRGKQFARHSNAPYRVTGQPNIPGLRRALMVYDAVEDARRGGVKRPYWRIASDLNLVEPDKRVVPKDSPSVAEDKRNVMKAIVSRLRKRAEALIIQSASRTFIG